MSNGLWAILVAVGIGVLAQPLVAQGLKVGSVAPSFSGVASDGKTYSLASVQKSGKPTVLYFIGASCPVNAEAVKYYNRVATAYKGSVNFIGVIDTDAAGYKKWQQRFNAPYPVMFDPSQKIIKAYKAERSPWTVFLAPTGKVGEEWPGYSVTDVNELGAMIAKSAKVPVKKIDTAGAPTSSRFG